MGAAIDQPRAISIPGITSKRKPTIIPKPIKIPIPRSGKKYRKPIWMASPKLASSPLKSLTAAKIKAPCKTTLAISRKIPVTADATIDPVTMFSIASGLSPIPDPNPINMGSRPIKNIGIPITNKEVTTKITGLFLIAAKVRLITRPTSNWGLGA